ncbi:unnamed protein product [Ectocarpus sp. CCAP 1310/34]|nr:unnamed protein product [Ectocarpus sp. CCAP 1310/34]
MKASAIGLACFAGIAHVSGFVSHVIPRGSRVSHDVSSLVASRPLPRPYRPTAGRANSNLFMKKGGAHLREHGERNRTRHLTSRIGHPGGLHKVALLALAGAVSCQLLPHAAVAATETAVPIASAAVDGTLVERLTSSGFFQAFSLVFVSEIGDKTFFIAALLAAKTSRLISFAGSVGALAVMTVLAVLLGLAFHSVPSVFTSGLPLDDIIAAAAFLYFGINTLKDAYALPDDSNQGIEEERAEAEESVKELEGKKTVWALILQTFSLVFAAEFGDRSFLTTIALGAAQNPFGVASGAIVAHASATGIAVTGGALLSQYISEKVIGYIGGALFVVFAVTTAIGIF